MNERRTKFIQITDTHLFSSKNGELLGMNTQASLNAVLECIANEEDDFDFFLCTGDLSQDGSVSSYNRFKSNLSKLLPDACPFVPRLPALYALMRALSPPQVELSPK